MLFYTKQKDNGDVTTIYTKYHPQTVTSTKNMAKPFIIKSMVKRIEILNYNMRESVQLVVEEEKQNAHITNSQNF